MTQTGIQQSAVRALKTKTREKHFVPTRIGDNATSSPAAPAPGDASVNPTFDKRVKDAIAGAKTPGYDEFLTLFTTLHEDIADEATCFKSALKAINKTDSLTAAQIVAAVKERQKIVEDDYSCFQKDLDDEVTSKIAGKTKEAQDLGNQIASKKLQLAALQKEIEGLSQAQEKAASSIDVITDKKIKRLAEYKLVYESHKAGLSKLAEKLQPYTVGGN